MAIFRAQTFLLLKVLLIVYMVCYLRKAWFGSVSSTSHSENLDNDLQWRQFEDNQRDVFIGGPALIDKDINLVYENGHKKAIQSDGFDRKTETRGQEQTFKNRQNTIAERRRREVTKSVYGKGCGDNPFRPRLRRLLRYWNKLVSAHNMEYFLCFGSLLGYHRTRDVIPYDHDIDICMNQRDFHRLVKLESKRPFRFQDDKPRLVIQRNYSNARRMNCRGSLVNEKVDPCSILSPPARVVLGFFNFLDVFLYRTGNEYVKKPNLKFVEREIYPVNSCSFMGLKARCPYDTLALVTRFYGADDGWNRPHHVCRNGQWVANGENVTQRKLQWALEILKRKINLTRLNHA